METQVWPVPVLHRGICRPAAWDPLYAVSEKELGGRQSPHPILAKFGASWEARPDPPHPSETHVSGLTAVFHWPATAASGALVPDAGCSTTFSWRPGLTAAQESYCTCEKVRSVHVSIDSGKENKNKYARY